jgi:two-component system nitrate/nitrite response regulator NarL
LHNSILIIDEDRLFCDALGRVAAASGFRVVAVCPDVTVALARATGETTPGIVLADVSAVDADGLRRLRAQVPDVRIGLLGDVDEAEVRDLAPDAVLAKALSAEALVAALSLLALDMAVLPRRLAPVLPSPDRSAAGGLRSGSGEGLTSRERDILRLLAEGEGNRRIADRLGITESTVKMHCKSLLRKLGVPNRTQAALLAHRWGLVTDTTGRPPATFQRR